MGTHRSRRVHLIEMLKCSPFAPRTAASRYAPVMTAGQSATVESEHDRHARRRSQFDPEPPTAGYTPVNEACESGRSSCGNEPPRLSWIGRLEGRARIAPARSPPLWEAASTERDRTPRIRSCGPRRAASPSLRRTTYIRGSPFPLTQSVSGGGALSCMWCSSPSK